MRFHGTQLEKIWSRKNYNCSTISTTPLEKSDSETLRISCFRRSADHPDPPYQSFRSIREVPRHNRPNRTLISFYRNYKYYLYRCFRQNEVKIFHDSRYSRSKTINLREFAIFRQHLSVSVIYLIPRLTPELKSFGRIIINFGSTKSVLGASYVHRTDYQLQRQVHLPSSFQLNESVIFIGTNGTYYRRLS